LVKSEEWDIVGAMKRAHIMKSQLVFSTDLEKERGRLYVSPQNQASKVTDRKIHCP